VIFEATQLNTRLLEDMQRKQWRSQSFNIEGATNFFFFGILQNFLLLKNLVIHTIYASQKKSIKIHKYVLKLIYYKCNMSALHQKDRIFF
jgi:hypothetical protein